MKLHLFIREHSESILDQAFESVTRAELPHYPKSSEEVSRSRLARLLDLTSESLERMNLSEILCYAQELGEHRFHADFDLSEVQTAINVLEEAIWEHCVRLLPPAELPKALGLCATVLGATKDCLARTYVSLASKTHVTTLNLQALFSGIESGTATTGT